MALGTPSASDLQARFEAPGAALVGIEEELMLLDPDDLDLAAAAGEALEALEADRRYKLELPASQLEIALPPARNAGEAAAALAAARRRLAGALEGRVRPAAAGAHPFAAPEGALNRGPRYDTLAREYGPLARRQLVCALHVHVSIRGAATALAVYNALRCHLPEIAALAANAPFREGRDTGLASVRPLVCQLLPRQGLPPRLASWEDLAAELSWGARAGTVPDSGRWWWELRPNLEFGTLEVRVPDAQTVVAETAGLAALVHCLAVHLAERHAAGEPLPDAPTWRIAENRSAALRGGLDATLFDLATGRPRPARERLVQLVAELGPVAARLGCASELGGVEARLTRETAAATHRTVAAEGGVRGLAAWLADRFLEGAGAEEG